MYWTFESEDSVYKSACYKNAKSLESRGSSFFFLSVSSPVHYLSRTIWRHWASETSCIPNAKLKDHRRLRSSGTRMDSWYWARLRSRAFTSQWKGPWCSWAKRYHITREGSLVIFEPRVEDEGTYKCEAANELGKVSYEVSLYVEMSELFCCMVIAWVRMVKRRCCSTCFILLNCLFVCWNCFTLSSRLNVFPQCSVLYALPTMQLFHDMSRIDSPNLDCEQSLFARKSALLTARARLSFFFLRFSPQISGQKPKAKAVVGLFLFLLLCWPIEANYEELQNFHLYQKLIFATKIIIPF